MSKYHPFEVQAKNQYFASQDMEWLELNDLEVFPFGDCFTIWKGFGMFDIWV